MKRITLFCGHYGSGKTNLAVNYALALAECGRPVTVADMDIVNPYFRTKDSQELLEAHGVRLLSSPYANTNLDAPAMPASFYGLFEDKTPLVILDVGGDDRGAVALGRYREAILAENDYECLFVANFYRALTRTPAEAYEVLREVEAAGGVPVTGIVNNSNLGELSDAEAVLASDRAARELAAMAGVPLRFTSVKAELVPTLEGKLDPLFPLTLQEKYYK